MKTETQTILEQLSEAINGARSTGRTMYVFRQDERWWYSGKLPGDAIEYYIAYPSGDSDRASCTPEITSDDWTAFWHAKGSKPHFASPRKGKRRKAAQARQNPVFMSYFRKYFLMYCAFAPHIAFALCMMFSTLTGAAFEATWSLALPVCLVCIPLTLIWVICALQTARSETVGILGATLAIEAHFAFYIHLALITSRAAQDANLFLFTMIGSLAFSGVALLLLWDTQPAVTA